MQGASESTKEEINMDKPKKLPQDPNKLKLMTRELVVKHYRQLENFVDNQEKQLKSMLPPVNRSIEVVRLLGVHGEIVVTLSSRGKLELTVYDVERKPNGDLDFKTYLLFSLEEMLGEK